MPLGKPANYMLDLPDPTQAIAQNLQLAMGVQKMQQEQQFNASRIAENNARTAEIQQKTQQGAAADLRNQEFHLAVAKAPPTPEGMRAVMQQFPDKVKENKELFDSMEKTEREAALNQLSQIDSAMLSNNPDVVRKTISGFVQANETAGRKDQAQKYQGLLKMYEEQGPEVAYKALAPLVASAVGPDKYMEVRKGMQLLPDEARKAKAEADLNVDKAPGGKFYGASLTAEQQLGAQRKAEAEKAIQATNEARNLESVNKGIKLANLDEAQSKATTAANEANISPDMLKAKLEKEQAQTEEAQARTKEILRKAGDLPDNVYKDVKTAGDAIVKSQDNVNRYKDIRERLDQITSSGLVARGAEMLKRGFGAEGEVTRTRKDIGLIFNEKAIAALKGTGRMTKPEFDILRDGMPSETGNPENMKKMMDMMILMEESNAKQKALEQEWLAEFHRASSAPKDAVINGIQVHKGDQLASLQKNLLPDLRQVNAPAASAPAAPAADTTARRAALDAEIAQLEAKLGRKKP